MKNSVDVKEVNVYTLPGILRANDKMSSKKIIDLVLSEYKIPFQQICKKRNDQVTSEPRHVAMYLVKTYTKLSLVRCGMIIGRDHATVLNSIRVVNDLRATNRLFNERVTKLENYLNNYIYNNMSELIKDDFDCEYYIELPETAKIATWSDFVDGKRIKVGMSFLVKSFVDDKYQLYKVSPNLTQEKLGPFFNDDRVFVRK